MFSMDVETFNIIASVTLVVLTTVVVAALFIVIRTAIKVMRFVDNMERKANRLYSEILGIQRKTIVNTWLGSRFLRSIASRDFLRSVFTRSSS